MEFAVWADVLMTMKSCTVIVTPDAERLLESVQSVQDDMLDTRNEKLTNKRAQRAVTHSKNRSRQARSSTLHFDGGLVANVDEDADVKEFFSYESEREDEDDDENSTADSGKVKLLDIITTREKEKMVALDMTEAVDSSLMASSGP